MTQCETSLHPCHSAFGVTSQVVSVSTQMSNARGFYAADPIAPKFVGYPAARNGQFDQNAPSKAREKLLRGVACLPAPATVVEQLHAQQGRVDTGFGQPSVGVVARSVGEGVVAAPAAVGVVVAVGAKTSMLLVPTTVAEMLVPEMARRYDGHR